jgi:endoglucanase
MRPFAPIAVALLCISFVAFGPPRPAAAATCASSVGPGIAPPASVPAGVAGFHAAWYGQSGYMTLCPGAEATATVAYYNSGSFGWVSGRMGEVAYLGTWNPSPGQDRPSALGGDGTQGSPNTGWPRYDRIAIQPVAYVGPGQIAWFQFRVRAPLVAGRYALALRPLIEGATWMEDYGVFWTITVPNPDGTLPPPAGLSPLHVAGNALVDASGSPVQLRGVNRSGTEYACIQGWGIFDGPSDLASVQAIASWRANAVRVPLNEDCWLGINGVPAAYAGAAYQRAIADYVALLNQAGLYAILELHWSAPGTIKATGQSNMPDRDHSIAFWSSVASAYRGNGAVMLELFNEPFPDDNNDTARAWTCWHDGGACGVSESGASFAAAGMQELVTAIRQTGATNVIAVGGVQYSNALSGWLAHRPTDPTGNLVAAWHVYNFNTCSTASCFDATVRPVAAAVPVITTEIGTGDCSASFMNGTLGLLEQARIGYLAWTWDTWGTACGDIALIADYDGTPTQYGSVYRAYLAAR